jgi:hypothetical protein
VLLQLEIGFHVPGGAPRLLDGGFKLGRRDLEFLRPVGDLVRLAQRDQPAIGPAALLLVVRHPALLCRVEKIDASNAGNLTRSLAFAQVRACGDLYAAFVRDSGADGA